MEQKLEKLDNNYYKYAENTLRDIKKAYQDAYGDIKLEIADWYAKMDDIKAKQPEFKFSALRQLEDLQKQIDLILDQLALVETEALREALNGLYISDYIDLGRLNKQYRELDLNTPLPEFNQLQSAQVLETYMNMPEAVGKTAEIAKRLELDWWYSPIQGKWFDTRIQLRAEKLGYSIENKLRQAIIRGDSYNKVAGEMIKELDISFNSAKVLVRTELATAENQATIHNALKLGFNGLKWTTMHDAHVCSKCDAMDGNIYPIATEIRAGDLMPHPQCRCALVEVMLDENGKEIKSSFRDEAEEYLKRQAEKNKAKADKIKAMHLAKKK